MEFKSGDIVVVKEGTQQGQQLKVVESTGAILLLEDNEGSVIELYSSQVTKPMLLG